MWTEEAKFAPILLIKEAAGRDATAVMADVVRRFPGTLRPISAVSTRPYRCPEDQLAYEHWPVEAFEAMLEQDIIVGHTLRAGHEYGVDRLGINHEVCAPRGAAGILVGDDRIEQALRDAEYVVVAYEVPADDSDLAWHADRVSEIAFGLVDPDDGGLDKDVDVDLTGYED